ncbi:TMEM175 family protein [Glacieibacterium frigidum]|uniref:DUF1211 domain-containing protein n=1 Tax=Glacieibacterium frigidum TaxID=2593303 RepID=A0A552UG85_9SPHN|nr:TMEM175 family protein [Glacieibacterium frigidum]TRW17238.1 DUF1211 domain-containing protein [Glacieibacterium frigidum]
MTDRSAERLDGFTDAAFAFAVSLLVAGGGGNGGTDLWSRLADVPAFAIGFAIIGMFWHAHVRWRRHRGPGDGLSVLLTFVLVFVVLVFVFPLAAMADSFSAYILGRPDEHSLQELFTIYGVAFLAMSATMAALFADVLRRPDLTPAQRAPVLGDMIIWLILCGTAIVSTILAAQGGRAAVYAPMVYATLPVLIGGFAWRWRW